MIDYHKILRAYVSHVRDCEGVTYIHRYAVGGTAIETDLTDEEREALRKIDREVEQDA